MNDYKANTCPPAKFKAPWACAAPHHSSRPPVLPPRVAAALTGVKWDFLAFLYGFATCECSPKQHGHGLFFPSLLRSSAWSLPLSAAVLHSFSSLLWLCPTVYSSNTLERHLGRCQIRGLGKSAVVNVLGLVVRPHPVGTGALGYA